MWQSGATQPAVHTGWFGVSMVHWILIRTTGSLTFAQMLMHAIAHGCVQTYVWEFAPKVGCGKKIPFRTGKSNWATSPLLFVRNPQVLRAVARPSLCARRGCPSSGFSRKILVATSWLAEAARVIGSQEPSVRKTMLVKIEKLFVRVLFCPWKKALKARVHFTSGREEALTELAIFQREQI